MSNEREEPQVDERQKERQKEGHKQISEAESGSGAARILPKIIPFRDLCRCGDEVWIEHQGQLYRLRCTKQGKLLLTK